MDTGIWKAHLDKNDQWHGLVNAILRELADLRTPLVTTDVVILEFVTLARKDISLGKIEEYIESIFESSAVEYTIATDLHSARRFLKNYSAIPFSGFDASSLAVMDRLEISRVLTIDDEFIRCNKFIEVRPTYAERETVLNP